jgi:hypothetical protein
MVLGTANFRAESAARSGHDKFSQFIAAGETKPLKWCIIMR